MLKEINLGQIYLLNDIKNWEGKKMNSTITVDKQNLLNTLQINKEQHIKMYNESINGYIEDLKNTLNKKIDEVGAGKIDSLHINLRKPESHEKDYNRAIKMLEFHVNSTIELGEKDFATLAMDDWDWSQGWLVSNSSYSTLVSGCAVIKGYL